MNDCARIQENLGAWLDGELNRGESERIRVHLESCAVCRAAQRSIEQTDFVLRGVLAGHAAKVEFTSFWRGVERRIHERRPWYRDWLDRAVGLPRSAWAVPAVIALLLALLSFDSYLPGWRGSVARAGFAAVDSIDAHGRSVALLRENETKTTVIWLYEDQEGGHETAEEAPRTGPAF